MNRIQKVKVESKILTNLNKVNDKENGIIRATIKDDDWLSSNVNAIYSDDNLYLIDMGESIDSYRCLIRIENFKVLLKFLNFLHLVDIVSIDDLENKNKEVELVSMFSEMDYEFVSEAEDFIVSDKIEEYL
jgi:hypothetical protein